MKSYLQIVVVCLSLVYSSFSSAQNQVMPLETKGDDYLPNEFNNKKTSAPYKSTSSTIRNTSIFTMQVNVDSDQQNILGDAGNEPNIAVNPKNKDQVVIGWRQFDNISSNFRQAGWSYTSDGGQTWTFPGKIEAGIFRSDPVLDFDTAGNFYYNSLTLVNNIIYQCKVFKSEDGGASWDDGTEAHGGDKQWMAIDRTSGIGGGNIYSFWTSAYSSCYPDNFTRSTDDDATFEDCTTAEGDPYWGTMAVGKDGELYIVGGGNTNNLVVAKSIDVQVPDEPFSWDAVQVYIDGNIGFSGDVNPEGLLGQANIDVDRSDGEGQGNVYVLASVARSSINDPGDVMFSRSTDGGSTWSSPMRVNDDASQTNTQWFGCMSVAPNGRIDAVWLDTRGGSTFADSSALYYSYSLDHGDTWSVNEQLSDLFNPHVGYPNQNKMGDYFDMVSDNTSAHLAWANTLNGEEDVYYSRITPDVVTTASEIHGLNFSIFPNPTNGKFVLTNHNPDRESRLDIFNAMGEKIYSSSIPKSQTGIDISSHSSGIYFVRVTDEEGYSQMKKIILQ